MKNKKRIIELVILSALLVFGYFYIPYRAQGAFYAPDNDDWGHSPAYENLQYEDVFFSSKDGTQLHAWFVPAQGAGAELPEGIKGTVILVHGNAGNLTGHWPSVNWLPQRGYNVFLFDYRGYGQSQGHPSPEGLFEDTQSAIAYVRQRPGVDERKLLVIGQSLGGNNAIAAVGAGERQGVCALVIDSTFYSYSSMADSVLFGAGLLMNNDYSAHRHVRAVAPVPILFIHGTADEIVPYEQGVRLFELASEPKQFVSVPDGTHIMAFSGWYGDGYMEEVDAFFVKSLDECTALAR